MAATAAPGPAGLALQISERLGDGGGVGFLDLAGDRMAAERPGQRDRLRGREGWVEAGDRLAAGSGLQSEQLAVDRIAAGQHRDELVGLDLAVEAEMLGGVAEPVALGLALAGVVVLSAFGDLVEVVTLLAGAELPDESISSLNALGEGGSGRSRGSYLLRRAGGDFAGEIWKLAMPPTSDGERQRPRRDRPGDRA